MTAFTDSEALAGWNEGAKAWDEFVESGADYYRRQCLSLEHAPAPLSLVDAVLAVHVERMDDARDRTRVRDKTVARASTDGGTGGGQSESG